MKTFCFLIVGLFGVTQPCSLHRVATACGQKVGMELPSLPRECRNIRKTFCADTQSHRSSTHYFAASKWGRRRHTNHPSLPTGIDMAHLANGSSHLRGGRVKRHLLLHTRRTAVLGRIPSQSALAWLSLCKKTNKPLYPGESTD